MRRTSSKRHLLDAGIAFHGHLGPYLVLGLRMGSMAVQKLKPKRLHDLSAIVWTRRLPPESCVLDGIQVSSGCTLGKGNIKTKESRHTKARFRNGSRTLIIGPSRKAAELLSRISEESAQPELRKIAFALDRMRDRELFTVESIP